MPKRITKLKVATSLLIIISFFVSKWIILPVESIAFLDSFVFYGIYLTLAIAVISLFFSKYNGISFKYLQIVIGIGVFSVLAIAAICSIIGSGTFNSTIKHNQIGTIVEKEYISNISPIDLEQLPYVDTDLARKLGDTKLGEDAELKGKVRIGTFTMQQVNGKLVLVAPLVHTEFFKYLQNKDGTPGYIVISASNSQDIKLVREIYGKPIKIKYQEEAFFGKNLKRHVWSQGLKAEDLTNFSLELDDSGYPYWIITTSKNTTLFGSSEATGTIVVDAMTGECTKYNINETPKWIDIIQPKEFIQQQITNYGEYVHGIFNFSNKDKIKTTAGLSTIYNNGELYYYTGLSSYKNYNDTIGFILVNARTKGTIRYTLNGACESAAMRSAKGSIQNFGYKANFPLLVNLDGVLTYFMTLKDTEGLIKMYAFVNIIDYSTVGVGNSILDAKKNYSSMYLNSVSKSNTSKDTLNYSLEGKIDRIAFKVENGNTMYTFSIQGKDILFIAPSILTEELTITHKGDTVKIIYVDNKNLDKTVIEFKNLSITTRIINDSTENDDTKVTTID